MANGPRFDIGGIGYSAPTTASVADTHVRERLADTSMADLTKDVTTFGIKTYVGKEQADLKNKLRKIVAAREQGALSADAASVRARAAVRESTARLPGMGNDFRQQAAEFFSEFGEGGGALDLTTQEKAQEKLQMDNALWYQGLQQRAAEMGTTVDGLVYLNSVNARAQEIDNLNKIAAPQNYEAFNQRYNGSTQAWQINRLERLTQQSRGGLGITPDVIARETALLSSEKARLDMMVAGAKVTSAAERKAMQDQVDGWYEGQLTILQKENINEFLQAEATRGAQELTIMGNKMFGAFAAASKVFGDQTTMYMMNASGNAARMDILRKISPTMADAIDTLSPEGFSLRMNEVVYGTRESIPGVSQQELGAAVTQQAVDDGAPDDLRERSLSYLSGTPENPSNLSAYNYRTVRKRVLQNPEMGSQLDRAIASKQGHIKGQIVENNYFTDLHKARIIVEQSRHPGIADKVKIRFGELNQPGERTAIPMDLRRGLENLLTTVHNYPERFLTKYNSVQEYALSELQLGGVPPRKVEGMQGSGNDQLTREDLGALTGQQPTATPQSMRIVFDENGELVFE